MQAKFIKSEEVADKIRSFYFQPEKKAHYTAGQFTELYLPHEDKDNRGDKRWFTLSSAPSDELLSITTNLAASPLSSFKTNLLKLKPDTMVHMASPMGDFVLPKDPSISLIFVAGGIGCTPYHSIIAELNKTDEKREITLLYAARNLDSVAFRDTFSSLGDRFKIILSEPSSDWEGLTGKLDAKQIIELGEITPEHYVYISGPEPMIEALNDDLKSQGINKQHIYTDYFPGYPAP